MYFTRKLLKAISLDMPTGFTLSKPGPLWGVVDVYGRNTKVKTAVYKPIKPADKCMDPCTGAHTAENESYKKKPENYNWQIPKKRTSGEHKSQEFRLPELRRRELQRSIKPLCLPTLGRESLSCQPSSIKPLRLPILEPNSCSLVTAHQGEQD